MELSPLFATKRYVGLRFQFQIVLTQICLNAQEKNKVWKNPHLIYLVLLGAFLLAFDFVLHPFSAWHLASPQHFDLS